MSAQLIAQAQRAELDRCIKILSTLRAEKELEGVVATGDDCITALQAARSTSASEATASDILERIEKLQAELNFERTKSRAVISHTLRVTSEHAAMLEVLERCALVLSPHKTERNKAFAFYQQRREFGHLGFCSCRDEIKALIASILETKTED